MSDLIYGTVELPDGRQCEGKLWGINHRPPDGFEIRHDDPLECLWVDGTDFSDQEYDDWGDFIMDYLFDHGKFEPWEPDYEGPWDI